MIKKQKLPLPAILQKNYAEWSNEYLACLESGKAIPENIKNRYRHNEIKEQIRSECFDKCVYCESKISHISPGDVEHILPKAHRPDLIFEWANLTYACEQCNRSGKRDYYDPNDPLINPYVDEPDEHLIAFGPIIFHKPGSRKGEISKSILKLNRTELVERRREAVEAITPLVDKWAAESNSRIKMLLKEEILNEMTDDKEYVFIIRHYLRAIGFYGKEATV